MVFNPLERSSLTVFGLQANGGLTGNFKIFAFCILIQLAYSELGILKFYTSWLGVAFVSFESRVPHAMSMHSHRFYMRTHFFMLLS
jgi:hypothetical protein